MYRLRHALRCRRLLAPSLAAFAFLFGGVTAAAQVSAGPRIQVRGAAGAFAYDTTVLRLPRSPGRLEGTLLKPRGVSRPPLVLLVGGAGPTDRNGNLVGAPGRHDALRQLAESLAVNGIASFRFDKRGVAGSASARIPEEEMRFQIFGYDIASWIDLLERRSSLGPLFVAGHDEGALTGLLSRRLMRSAAGYILLASPSRNPADEIHDQMVATQPLAAVEIDSVIEALRDRRPVTRLSLAASAMFPVAIHGYLSSRMQFSAMDALSALPAPCLVVHGRHDAEVAPANADTLAKAQPGCLRTIVDSMTHTLKRGPSTLDEQGPMYLDPALPLAPGLMSALLDFIHLIIDQPPDKCSSEADGPPRVLIGRPTDRPNGASPVIFGDRHLGPFAAATLAGTQLDSIGSQQLLTGDDAAQYGATARKCGALLMRTTEGFAGDTAEVIAAIWKAEGLLHRPTRVVRIDVADSSGGAAMSPLLRREISRRGVAMSQSNVVGDDTVRVVPDLTAFGRSTASDVARVVSVRTQWTTRVDSGSASCRVTWRATTVYSVFVMGGAVHAKPVEPVSPTFSGCEPIPPELDDA